MNLEDTEIRSLLRDALTETPAPLPAESIESWQRFSMSTEIDGKSVRVAGSLQRGVTPVEPQEPRGVRHHGSPAIRSLRATGKVRRIGLAVTGAGVIAAAVVVALQSGPRHGSLAVTTDQSSSATDAPARLSPPSSAQVAYVPGPTSGQWTLADLATNSSSRIDYTEQLFGRSRPDGSISTGIYVSLDRTRPSAVPDGAAIVRGKPALVATAKDSSRSDAIELLWSDDEGTYRALTVGLEADAAVSLVDSLIPATDGSGLFAAPAAAMALPLLGQESRKAASSASVRLSFVNLPSTDEATLIVETADAGEPGRTTYLALWLLGSRTSERSWRYVSGTTPAAEIGYVSGPSVRVDVIASDPVDGEALVRSVAESLAPADVGDIAAQLPASAPTITDVTIANAHLRLHGHLSLLQTVTLCDADVESCHTPADIRTVDSSPGQLRLVASYIDTRGQWTLVAATNSPTTDVTSMLASIDGAGHVYDVASTTWRWALTTVAAERSSVSIGDLIIARPGAAGVATTTTLVGTTSQ